MNMTLTSTLVTNSKAISKAVSIFTENQQDSDTRKGQLRGSDRIHLSSLFLLLSETQAQFTR